MPLRAGSRLGPRKSDQLSARGGMGDVYGARDTKLKCDVTVRR